MKTIITSMAMAVAVPSAFGAAGIYDSFIFTTTDGTSPSFFYGLGGGTPFAGADLGTFDPTSGDTLQFGGQQKSYKNNGTDVSAHTLHYSIDGGSFQTVALNFQWNNGDGGAPAGLNNAGDQQWGGDVQGGNGSFTISADVLSGLAIGSHTVDAYTTITTNGADGADPTIFNNDGGSNFSATFTTVPEPSSAALLGLGGLALILRRRK